MRRAETGSGTSEYDISEFFWPLTRSNVAIRADGSQDLAPVRDVIAMLTVCYMRLSGPTGTPAGEIYGEHRHGRMS